MNLWKRRSAGTASLPPEREQVRKVRSVRRSVHPCIPFFFRSTHNDSPTTNAKPLVDSLPPPHRSGLDITTPPTPTKQSKQSTRDVQLRSLNHPKSSSLSSESSTSSDEEEGSAYPLNAVILAKRSTPNENGRTTSQRSGESSSSSDSEEDELVYEPSLKHQPSSLSRSRSLSDEQGLRISRITEPKRFTTLEKGKQRAHPEEEPEQPYESSNNVSSTSFTTAESLPSPPAVSHESPPVTSATLSDLFRPSLPGRSSSVDSNNIARKSDIKGVKTAATTIQTLRRTASAGDAKLILTPLPSSSPSTSPATSSTTNLNGGKDFVIGPAKGARLLASDEARFAQSVANRAESEFSINSRALAALDPTPSSSGSEEREGTLRELTRRASAEDEVIKADRSGTSDAARKRANSIVKGKEAGLRTPFGSPSQAPALKKRERGETEREERRFPPTSGAIHSSGGGGYTPRQRTNSTSSTGSVNKDFILGQLADALKREKKRCAMYEDEIKSIEEEIDEIEGNMRIMKEKQDNSLNSQKNIISSLRTELEEVKRDLATTHDLDAADAEEYLSLLQHTSISPSVSTTSLPISSRKQIKPVKGSKFAETGLQNGSSSENDLSKPTSGEGKKRRFNLARRINGHLAAHSSDGEFEKEAVTVPVLSKMGKKEGEEGVAHLTPTKPLVKRVRKLSKTRRPSFSLPTSGNGERTVVEPKKRKEVPPVEPIPLNPPVIPASIDTPKPAPMKEKDKPKAKPIRSNSTSGAVISNPVLPNEPAFVRPRKNSFSQGIASTLRVLFPPHAEKANRSRTPSPYPDDRIPDTAQIAAQLRENDDTKAGDRSSKTLYGDGGKVGKGYANLFASQ